MTSTSDTPERDDASEPAAPVAPATGAPPEPTDPTVKPAPRHAPVPAIALAVAVAALLVGGAALVRPSLTPPPPAVAPAALDARLAPLEGLAARVADDDERIAALSRELTALRNSPARTAPAVDTAALDGLSARLDAAERNLADLAGKFGAVNDTRPAIDDKLAALASDLQALGGKLAALDERLGARVDGARGAEADALAAGLLRRATRGDRGYAAELRLARALLGDRARALDSIAARAETGVPGTAALAEGFRTLETAIARAGRAESDGGFWDRTLAGLSSLIVVRRLDGAPDGSVDAVVARIKSALRDGDAARAAAEADKLGEAPTKVAASWIADLRARAALDAAVEDLDRRAVEKLARAQGVEVAP